LAFALAIGATIALVVARGEDLRTIAELRPGYVAALLAMQVLYLIVQSARFHVVLVRFAERPVGFWPWTRMFVIGRFLNLFVPQAGNVYRAVELRRRFDVSVQSFLVAFVNAPWLAMILNFLFGALFVGLLAPAAEVAGWPLWALLAAATVGTSLAPIVAIAMLPLFPARFRWAAWSRARLAEMVSVTLRSVREPGYLARVGWWTLLAFVQASAMMWIGFVALGIPVGVAEAIAFYVLLQLATYVQLTPGNLGLQEFAFAALSAGFGATVADGVLVSTIVRVTGVIALVATALPVGGLEALRLARSAPAPAPGGPDGSAGPAAEPDAGDRTGGIATATPPRRSLRR
jgi:uncharacterized membrane protein YbhN (UPF0104 family)